MEQSVSKQKGDLERGGGKKGLFSSYQSNAKIRNGDTTLGGL